MSNVSSLIPKKSEDYIPFGFHDDLKCIINSKKWCPVFITGLSGNGKTTTVEQVCAEISRPLFRVNITCETDEGDLLGGMRLEKGETVFHYGPVVEAMRCGGILLLDEVDLASTKIMCIQPVLEGKGVFLKKIGERIDPAIGFNVIATANTKGQGSDDGKFIGTNVMNEAFLDRFLVTVEHDYPNKEQELKIINKFMDTHKCKDEEFAHILVEWANQTRENKKNSMDAEDHITTRRLLHIVTAYSIFKDREKSVMMALARFNKDTKDSFWSLYKSLDESIHKNGFKAPPPPKEKKDSIPFDFKKPTV